MGRDQRLVHPRCGDGDRPRRAHGKADRIRQTDAVAICEHLWTRETRAVDKRAVGAAQVLDDKLVPIPGDTRVIAGNVLNIDHNIIIRRAPDGARRFRQSKVLTGVRPLVHGQFKRGGLRIGGRMCR